MIKKIRKIVLKNKKNALSQCYERKMRDLSRVFV
jgi:hypothetical protein